MYKSKKYQNLKKSFKTSVKNFQDGLVSKKLLVISRVLVNPTPVWLKGFLCNLLYLTKINSLSLFYTSYNSVKPRNHGKSYKYCKK